MAYNPDGVFLSNGPGDPKKCVKTIECVRKVFDKVPFMGICLGAQILALSMGGDTYKLKFGHRAQNQPAPRPNQPPLLHNNSKIHGYAVDIEYLKKTPLETWFLNANDKTTEGIKIKTNQSSPNGQMAPRSSQDPTIRKCCLTSSQKHWRL